MRTMARTRSSSVDSVTASTPERRKASFTALLAGPSRLLEALAEPRVAGVHVELLARLRVLHDDRADVGQVGLARVDQADGEDLVPPVEQVERPFPAGCADEVGDDDDQRAPLDRVVGGLEERG